MDANLEDQMRDFLRDKWSTRRNPRGFHIRKREIRSVGSDPDAAEDLFEVAKGTLWEGDYIKGNRLGWVGAWVADVG